MAVAAVRSGGSAYRRARFPAAFALLMALCAAPAARQACAEEGGKVWRALTEEDRRGRTPPVVPGGSGNHAAPASRSSVLVYVVSGVVVAVFAGVVVAVLASARRLPKAPVRPRSAEPEPESESENAIERIWSYHLRRKRRQRGPDV